MLFRSFFGFSIPFSGCLGSASRVQGFSIIPKTVSLFLFFFFFFEKVSVILSHINQQ